MERLSQLRSPLVIPRTPDPKTIQSAPPDTTLMGSRVCHKTTKDHASQENTCEDRHKIPNIHSHLSNHPITSTKSASLLSYNPICQTNNKYPIPASTTSIPPSNTASLALHGLTLFFLSTYLNPPLCLFFTTPKTSKKLMRTANKVRKIAANAIRKIHVPAYWPVDVGVQDEE